MTAMANPGVGNGSIISCTSPGTRVGRIRLTNTVSYGLTCPMSLTWCFSATSCGYPTKVSAYVGGLATDISAFGTFTTSYLCNPCINKPVNIYNVTPASGSYCEGESGVLVGLDGSELGVTYTTNPGTVVQPGTGNPISFGVQLAGNYTVTGARNCTYISGSMAGSANIVLQPKPDPAGPIAGVATVTEGNTNVPYTVAVIPNATSYVWTVTGGVATISGGAGTNSILLDFPMGQCNLTVRLHVYGTNVCGNGLDSYFDIFIDCSAPPPPIPFNVTGGGSYCEGTGGVPVGLDGSEIGVSYELYMDAGATGITHIGDGLAFSFGNQLGTHTYTVLGTNIAFPALTTMMNGSALITENANYILTNIISLVSLPPFCDGAPLEFSCNTSYPPEFCDWYVDNNIQSYQGMNFIYSALAGSHEVYCVAHVDPALWPCWAAQTVKSNHIVLFVNPWVTPTFDPLGPYCQGDIPDLLPGTSIENVTGTWNPPVISTAVPGTTTYIFTPDPGQCAYPASMDIVVNPLVVPTLDLVLNPNPFCYCEYVTATAVTNVPPEKITLVVFEVDGNVVQVGNGLTYTWHPGHGNHIVKVTMYFSNKNNIICWTTNEATAQVTLNESTTVLGTLTWNGSVSEDWHNPQNWNPNMIPNCCYDVVIPSGMPHYPTLSAQGACHDIFLYCRATLLDNSFLTICGCPYVYQCCIAFNTLDWHLSSSPIKHALSGYYQDLFGNSVVPQPVKYFLQSFDEPTNAYTEISATNVPLNVMEGYGLYVDCHHCDTIIWGSLSCDTLNIGDICHLFTHNNLGWNLLGNPFVSSIDWDAVVIPPGMSGEVHYIDAATGNDLFYLAPGLGNGSRYIPPMQGFFVSAFDNGQLCIGDAQRTHVGANFYYKSDNPKLVVLKAQGEQYSDETWIHFNEAAGVEHDNTYDAYKRVSVSNPLLPQIFSLTPGGTRMAINGMPQASTVPVGFTAVKSGTFTINAKNR